MRRLPIKPNEKQKRIIDATFDFFGEATKEESQRVRKIAIWLMGRRKGNKLEQEDLEIAGLIRNNLADLEYFKSPQNTLLLGV